MKRSGVAVLAVLCWLEATGLGGAWQNPAWVQWEHPPSAPRFLSEVRVPTPAHYLQAAGECHQRGEYDLADRLLQKAEAGRDQLSPTAKLQLEALQRANRAALGTRPKAPETVSPTLLVTPKAPTSDNDPSRSSPSEAALKAGREALRQGRFDQAEQLARQAEILGHRTWVPWSDSPHKLLRDVQQARSLTAREMLRQARLALRSGDCAKARHLVEQAEALRPTLLWWDDLHPAKVRAELAARESSRGSNPEPRPAPAATMAAAPGPVAPTPVVPAQNTDPDHEQRLAEELRKEALGQFDASMAAADLLVSQGRFREAEQYLLHARALALRYHWPTYAVNERLMRLRVQADDAERAADQAPEEARKLLEAIEREAQAGRWTEARRLAETLYSAPYGLKLHASGWLARLDDLEFDKARREAERHYELAVQAFTSKDYEGAALYLAAVDVRLLDARRQAHATELHRSLESLRQTNKKD